VLPVAFEALSAKPSHSGKSASPKPEPEQSTQFAAMIDDQVTADASSSSQAASTGGAEKSTADGAGKSPTTAKPTAASAASIPNGQHLISLPLPENCTAATVTDDQVAKTAGSKNAVGKATKVDQQQLNNAIPTAGPVDGGPRDSQAEFEVDTVGPFGAITGDPAPTNSGKQSTKVAGDEKATKQPDDGDSAAPADQVADDSAPPAAATLNAQPAAAIVAVIDPTVPVSDVVDQVEPQHAAITTSSAALGKAGDALPDSNLQPHMDGQSVADKSSLTAQAVELPLIELDSDADPDAPVIIPDLEQAAKAHGKPAQGSESTKAVPLLQGQVQSTPDQPDAGIAPQNPGLTAQPQTSNGAAVPQPSRSLESDPQASAVLKDDRLPKDVSTVAKASSTLLPSSMPAPNGINIAVTTGALHDPGATAALAASPQSAPAALVPVSGIAVEIASKALAGKNRFEIRLDPPELGRIHVRLDVDSSGQISSHVVADRSDTLDLLRRDAPSLERALQDAGLKTSNNGLQFSLRDHGGFGRQAQPLPMPSNTRLIVSDEMLPAETTHAYRPLAGLRSGLDIRV
jgi:flagellar hook-length control protein FliK